MKLLLFALVLAVLLALPAFAKKTEFADLAVNTPRAKFKSLAECPKDYRLHTLKHRAKGDARAFFRKLMVGHPAKAWVDPSRFVQLFDLNDRRSVRTETDALAALRPGQVITLELKIALGMKIPVTFEVTTVEPEKMHAVFGYVATNVSTGVQDITFRQDGADVAVEHVTCYSSGKKMRDKVFYPPIHSHLIKKFYERLFASK